MPKRVELVRAIADFVRLTGSSEGASMGDWSCESGSGVVEERGGEGVSRS